MLINVYLSFRNFIVPYGSFGNSEEAKKAETFAFLIKLLIWIPLYLIFGLLIFIFAQTGWFVSMLASTGIQPYFEAPSILICPLALDADIYRNVNTDKNYTQKELSFLGAAQFYIVLRSQGILGYKKAQARHCGISCLCFDTNIGNFTTLDNRFIEKHPIEKTYIIKTSKTKSKSLQLNDLNLSGRLDVDYLELWILHKYLDPDKKIVKVGLYGSNTPLVHGDFPKTATWHIMKLGDVTLYLLRLIRIRLEEFSLYQILDLILFILPNIFKRYEASYYMYNIHSGHFPNKHIYSLNVMRVINKIKLSTNEDLQFEDSDALTILHLEASSKFIKEVYKIGQSMSIAAFIGCLVVLIVLVKNVGVFYLCFKRRTLVHGDTKQDVKPKLCVSGPVKAITCYVLSENHHENKESFSDIGALKTRKN